MISEIIYKKIELYLYKYAETNCKNYILRKYIPKVNIEESEYKLIEKLINDEFLKINIIDKKIINELKIKMLNMLLLREKIQDDLIENETRVGLKIFINLNTNYYLKDYNKLENRELLEIIQLYNPIIYVTNREKRLFESDDQRIKNIPLNINKDSIIEILKENNIDFKNRSIFSLFNIASLYNKEIFRFMLEELYNNITSGSTVIIDYYSKDYKSDSLLETCIIGNDITTRYEFMEIEQMLNDVGFLVYEHLDNVELSKRSDDLEQVDIDLSKNYNIIVATKYMQKF